MQLYDCHGSEYAKPDFEIRELSLEDLEKRAEALTTEDNDAYFGGITASTHDECYEVDC